MTVIFGLLLAPFEGEAGVKPSRRGGKKGSKFSVVLVFGLFLEVNIPLTSTLTH